MKQTLESDTDAQLHDDRIITLREKPIQGVQDARSNVKEVRLVTW